MATQTIYFIDSRVESYQSLIGSFSADSEWFVLDANQDGLAQMQAILANYNNLDSIQILSHGAQGALSLGNTTLNSSNIASYSSALAKIGSSLNSAGDILLYGCNVAQGDIGQSFINTFAQLTGADVAASTDLTGASSLSGNSILEANSGVINTNTLDLNNYQSVLDILVNTAPTFSTRGIVSTNVGSTLGSQDSGRGVTIQADGKILVAGSSDNNFALARYNTDGSLDTSFSDDGKLTTVVSSTTVVGSQAYMQGNSATLQADGKILVAGAIYHSNDAASFALARYNTDGSLDVTFNAGFSNSGDGNGLVFTAIDTGLAVGGSVTMQADGKILVAGSATFNGLDNVFALARYNTNGSLDASFSGDGRLITFSDGASGASVTVQADGKILVAGSSENNFALVRYNTDGSLDTSFSDDGIATTAIGVGASGASVTVQADGKILVAGSSLNTTDSDIALVRYNPDGSLDTSFSDDGIATTAIGVGASGASVTVQADGKILVAGSSENNFALVRYNTDGSLDTSFSDDGIATTAIGGDASGQSITVQADGKILVAGSSSNTTDGDFALVRFNSDGSLDATFNNTPNSASSLNNLVSFTEHSSPVGIANGVTIYDAELAALGNYGGASVTLARHGGASTQDVFSARGSLSALTQSNDLVLSGTIIGEVTQNSVGILTLAFNSNATQARVNEALSSLGYLNTSSAPPTSVQLDWTFNDGNTGTQGTGGALSVLGSTLVNITLVNEAPSGTNGTIFTPLNTSYTFKLADFGFTDTEDTALTAVLIGTPALGNLKFDGLNIASGGSEISAADILAGRLTYVPVTGGSGATYSNFIFSVKDSGLLFDLTLNTITISVNFGETWTGTEGNDVHTGSSLNDTLNGLGGNDTLTGGTGADTLDGGDGIDTADYSILGTAVTAELWRGNAANDGTGSVDTFIAIENLTGGSGNDILTGNALTNVMNGGAGNDTVNGGAGNDTVNGGLGNDTMIGGTGVDTLNGGDGIDTADYSALATAVTAELWRGNAH